MKSIDWKQIFEVLNKYVLNKYVLALIIFAVIFIFVGQQSLLKDIKRNRQIRETENEISMAEIAIEQATRQLNTLQNTDSLERYAREHYLMHQDNEDIFLVDEE